MHSERATIAKRQGASENPFLELNPTRSKTDSSSCFGINGEDLKTIVNALENRPYLVCVNGLHAVTLIKNGEEYFLFDPNIGTVKFSSEEIIDEMMKISNTIPIKSDKPSFKFFSCTQSF